MAKRRRRKNKSTGPCLTVPRRNSGRRVSNSAKVTMPLKALRRALAAAKKGTRAIIKARVH